MTFKIEQYATADCTIIRLIGQIGSEHLQLLNAQLAAASTQKVAFDLKELLFIHPEAISFLRRLCKTRGIKLQNPSLYIRERMIIEDTIK